MSHKLHLHKTRGWAPNGPMDYARSARKYNIAPTSLSSFFVRDGMLKRFLPSEHIEHDAQDVRAGNHRFMARLKSAFGKGEKQAPASVRVGAGAGAGLGVAAGTGAVGGMDPDAANEGQGETEVGAADVQVCMRALRVVVVVCVDA